jgi:hypothetical protein
MIFVPLASAVKLPVTPPPVSPDDLKRNGNPLPPLEGSESQRSSQISIDQKLQNMHDGIPAHFDHELGRVSLEDLSASKKSRSNETLAKQLTFKLEPIRKNSFGSKASLNQSADSIGSPKGMKSDYKKDNRHADVFKGMSDRKKTTMPGNKNLKKGATMYVKK